MLTAFQVLDKLSFLDKPELGQDASSITGKLGFDLLKFCRGFREPMFMRNSCVQFFSYKIFVRFRP